MGRFCSQQNAQGGANHGGNPLPIGLAYLTMQMQSLLTTNVFAFYNGHPNRDENLKSFVENHI